MDAKFQASFIPKIPIAPDERSQSAHISLFSLISLIIFILTLGLGGGVAIAKYMLTQKVAELNQRLIEAKGSFELNTINELKLTEQRINQAKSLVEKHIAFSEFFEQLEQTTYKNVTFNNFGYEGSAEGLKVTLKGSAVSFNTLSLQSDLLRGLRYLTNQSLSNFGLDNKGHVSFDFSAVVDPALINYKTGVVGDVSD